MVFFVAIFPIKLEKSIDILILLDYNIVNPIKLELKRRNGYE